MSLKTNYFTVKIKKAILSNSIISSVIRKIKLPFRLFWGRSSKPINPIPKKNIKKILVVALYGGIGDSILSTPAIKALRKAYSNAKIMLLTRPLPGSMAQRWAFVDEIVIFDENSIHKSLKAKVKLLNFLRRERFDMTIDFLWDSITSALITFYSNARYIVGFDVGVLGVFYNRTVTRSEDTHVVDLWLRLVESVNAEHPEKIDFEVQISKDERLYAEHLLEKECFPACASHADRDDALLIGIHPGARAIELAEKRWPIDKYAELANTIQKKYNAKIILIGGPGEEALGQRILESMNSKPLNTIGKTTVPQMIAIIHRCHLLICNNSGPLHVAVALGVPTISFVGGADLQLFHPYGNSDKHKVLCARWGAYDIEKDNSCMKCPYSGLACLEALSVEEVLNVVDV